LTCVSQRRLRRDEHALPSRAVVRFCNKRGTAEQWINEGKEARRRTRLARPLGPPGVGKSHIATAIAVGAIRAGCRALVRSTFDLAADFAEADATGARREFVQQLTRVDLLVLEDFGMK
jgi:DNA replication protein DnaC